MCSNDIEDLSKLMKKEERMYMKGAKKAQKADKKRNKKARKKPKND